MTSILEPVSPGRVAGAATPPPAYDTRSTAVRRHPAARELAVAGVFATCLFVGALLLFSVQPMIAKMLLPLLGGTPAVWNTCLLFFQATLLLGYLYAHGTARLGTGPVAWLHVGLLAAAFVLLPIGLRAEWIPPATGSPAGWLLTVLAISVGVPFLLVSTTAPLLQAWFARTRHRAAGDPYFLYAASNLGSFAALLAYPLWIEPRLALAEQAWWWSVGYATLVVLVAIAAWIASSGPGDDAGWRPTSEGGAPTIAPGSVVRPLAAGRRLRWVLLAFVPSSMMLAVTTHITTDLASIPLLWVMPLAIYLLSFVLVFARLPFRSTGVLSTILPGMVLLQLFVLLVGMDVPLQVSIVFNLTLLFVTAMVCHGQLAEDRPHPGQLTQFYLWMSLGGVLGGAFNALAAPVLFDSIAEYPLTLALACLLLPASGAARSVNLRDLLLPAGLAGLAWLLLQGLPAAGWEWEGLRVVPCIVLMALASAFRLRPPRLALGVLALFLVGAAREGSSVQVLQQERSFFGVLKVRRVENGRYHELVHGTTHHGKQSRRPNRRREPQSYYARSSPIGQVLTVFAGPLAKNRVAVIGLGTGTLAAYGEPGQEITYYEIDPLVESIARDPRYFTYLADSRADVDVVLGDARLRIADAPAGRYGLIVVDAFSSDAIPVHLLTREAVQLYLDKLAADGLLLFHTSNRYLRLEPVVAALAEDAGLVALGQSTGGQELEYPTEWVMMARTEAALGPIAGDGRWERLESGADAPLWTDDFSNLVTVVGWRW